MTATQDPGTGGTGTLDDVATDAHSIAESLRGIKEDNTRGRALGFALLGSTIISITLIVLVVFLFIPIYRTARIVTRVAGPEAVAAQQAQSTETIQAILALFICTQRETTSQSRQMDGKAPLPLKQGCPPYAYDAPVPGILAPTTPTTTPKPFTTAKPKATTTTHASTSTSGGPPHTTVTTQASSVRCPTMKVLGTCITIPNGLP